MRSLQQIVSVSMCVSSMLILSACDRSDATATNVKNASNQAQATPATPAVQEIPAVPANALAAAPQETAPNPEPHKPNPPKPGQRPEVPLINDTAPPGVATPPGKPGQPPPQGPVSTVQIVKADPAEVDLGDIPTNDSKTGKVHLVNTGDKQMTILSARPSCGCTALKFQPNTVIEAGAALDIDVQMNGGARPGPLHGKVVTFVVEGQPEVVVQLKAQAVSFVTSEPATLDPVSMPEGKFVLKSVDNQPFRIMSTMPAVIDNLDKEAKAEHTLNVSWDKFREVGISRQLVIYLDHPKCQQVFMNVNFSQEEMTAHAQKLQQQREKNNKALGNPNPDAAPVVQAQLDPDTLLVNMIKEGRNSEVLQKLQTGLDVNYRDSSGASLLSLAAKHGNADLVKALIATGKIDINGTDNAGRTALMHAATAKGPEALQVLLDAGATMTTRDALGGTALWWAAMQGPAANVTELVDKGADVEIVGTVTGWTPLMVAAGFGEPGSIESLLAAHASVEAADMLEGATPLIHAARTGKIDNIKALLKHGANLENPDRNGNTPLLACAKTSGGDAEKVKFLIEAGANIHAKDNRGLNALELARKRTDIRAPDVIAILEPLLGSETPAAAAGEKDADAGS